MDDKMLFGVVGTAVSATGAGLSVTEIQAIVSIVVTVLGFIISVFVPLCIKLYQKIKKAKEDGKITKEELDDIVETGKEIVDKSSNLLREVQETKDAIDNKKENKH